MGMSGFLLKRLPSDLAGMVKTRTRARLTRLTVILDDQL
jgi:hypothetical protein